MQRAKKQSMRFDELCHGSWEMLCMMNILITLIEQGLVTYDASDHSPTFMTMVNATAASGVSLAKDLHRDFSISNTTIGYVHVETRASYIRGSLSLI